MSNVWLESPRPGVLARARIRTNADVREIERTPYRDLLPAWSVLDALERTAKTAPAKAAIIVVDKNDPTVCGERLTYAELAARVRALANRLHEVSGAAQPVVSILTPLVTEALIATWAGATAGIGNPINPFLRIDHVAEIMNAAGTTVLICGTADDGPGAWTEVSRLRAMVPTLRAVWVVGKTDRGSDSVAHQLSIAVRDKLVFARSEDPDRTVALLHTGGTTAAPKLVRHTERGQLLNAWCCGAYNGSGSDEVVALGMPYFHVGGAIALALSPIILGQTVVIVAPDGYRSQRVISRFWDLVDAHGVTLAGSAPTTAAAIVASYNGRRPPAGFSYWAGGSAVPTQVAREFADKFGVALREGWGMTELQGALALNPRDVEPRLGSIGIPFPYHRARCVPLGSRTADDSPVGAAGVLAIRGPCVTQGYLDASRDSGLFFEETSPGQTWLNTGDLCTIDSDGYVWIRGRSKDLIIRGGHNIDPLTIESALTSHPAVLYAAAVGEPDREKGEVPVGYVQLRPGMSVGEPELLSHCRQEITERAAIPRAVRVVEAMPLTAVGKVFKPALRIDAVRSCINAIMAQVEGAHAVDVDVCDVGGSVTVVIKTAKSKVVAAEIHCELQRYAICVEIEAGDL